VKGDSWRSLGRRGVSRRCYYCGGDLSLMGWGGWTGGEGVEVFYYSENVSW